MEDRVLVRTWQQCDAELLTDDLRLDTLYVPVIRDRQLVAVVICVVGLHIESVGYTDTQTNRVRFGNGQPSSPTPNSRPRR